MNQKIVFPKNNFIKDILFGIGGFLISFVFFSTLLIPIVRDRTELPDISEMTYKYKDVESLGIGDDYHDVVDNNTADKDATPDVGTENNFANCQDITPDTDVMTLIEENVGSATVNDYLAVTSRDTTYQNWDVRSGTTPYIDTVDDDEGHTGSHINEQKTSGATEGWFYFADTSYTGTGYTVNFTLRMDSDDGDIFDGVYIWYDPTGAGSGTQSALIAGSLGTTYNYYTYTLTGTYSQTQINNMRIYFEYTGNDDIYIDYCNMSIYKAGTADDYEADFEYQFNNVNTTKDYHNLCIYVTSITGGDSESLNVDYYDSGWQDLGTISSTGWTNFSATGISSTYNIRLEDTDSADEGTQTTWNIDVIKLRGWNLTWNTISDTINGSYSNITTWQNVDNTINGSYWNGTVVVLQYVNYTGTGDTFGSHVGDYLNLTFSDSVFKDGVNQGLWFTDASPNYFLTFPEWSTSGNMVIIYCDEAFGTPRPHVGANVTDIKNITDSYGRPVHVLGDGIEIMYGVQWWTVSDTINGSYSNISLVQWNTVSSSINGSYTNTTIFRTITSTINGSYSAVTAWSTVSSTINGSYTNQTSWASISTNINGSYTNVTIWRTEASTINGSYINQTDWKTITSTINGSYSAISVWTTVISTINGSYTNVTIWRSESSNINGSYANITSWKTISSDVNGTYTNVSTIWRQISSNTNGSYSNTTVWNTVSANINGSYSSITYWTTVSSTINGSYSAVTTWTVVDNTINGIYSNTTRQPQFSNPNPTNNSNNNARTLTWNITIYDNTGNFNWTIECSNGDNNSANNDGNGSKNLSLVGLGYYTLYTIWVNATNGNGLWTNETYYFRTLVAPLKADFATSQTGSNIFCESTSTGNITAYKWTVMVNNSEIGTTGWINESIIPSQIFTLPTGGEITIILSITDGITILHTQKGLGSVDGNKDVYTPEHYTSCKTCEDAGYYWYNDSCHKTDETLPWNVKDSLPEAGDHEVKGIEILGYEIDSSFLLIVVLILIFILFISRRRKRKKND